MRFGRTCCDVKTGVTFGVIRKIVQFTVWYKHKEIATVWHITYFLELYTAVLPAVFFGIGILPVSDLLDFRYFGRYY
jgi:hypothetical protein